MSQTNQMFMSIVYKACGVLTIEDQKYIEKMDREMRTRT